MSKRVFETKRQQLCEAFRDGVPPCACIARYRYLPLTLVEPNGNIIVTCKIKFMNLMVRYKRGLGFAIGTVGTTSLTSNIFAIFKGLSGGNSCYLSLEISYKGLLTPCLKFKGTLCSLTRGKP